MVYPIEKGEGGFWFVWSMQPQHVIGGEARAKGKETFPTYESGREECQRRNRRIGSGIEPQAIARPDDIMRAE